MSLIALTLNLLLAGLLLSALIIGIRLEKRLKAVRDGQIEFAKAVAELDAAALKARDGLADLRIATDEATDILGGRIARAREAADRLEKLVIRAGPAPAPRPAAAPTGPEGGLAALLQRIEQAEIAPQPVRPPAIADRPLRVRAPADDDLFEDLGGRA